MFEAGKVQAFVQRRAASRASERAAYQQFFVELCDLLGVVYPDPAVAASEDYRFDKSVTDTRPDGEAVINYIDFHKKDHFITEAKQGNEAQDDRTGATRRAHRVTREVATKLADLARDLENSKHDLELVAQFLMRCLFTMLSEDVGLLPEKPSTRTVEERWQVAR